MHVRIRNVIAGSPVNPTHQFGEVLVRRFDFPFIKSELLVVNPTNMSIALTWRSLVTEDSPCSVDMIVDHLCLHPLMTPADGSGRVSRHRRRRPWARGGTGLGAQWSGGVIVVESEDHIGTGELPQQRGDPCRHLLSVRPFEDAAMRGRQGDAVRVLPGLQRPAQAMRLVAVNAPEIEKLVAIKAQAEANGVNDLIWLSRAEARALEPALVGERALLSPSTGIIDSHALMLALRGDTESHVAMIALKTPVVSGRVEGRGLTIETGGTAPMRIAADVVVNAAGLGAQAIARSIAGMPAAKIPPLHLAKGNYFSLATRSPFSRLIYPVPTPGGLGVHLTLDLAGQARFGPDVEWLDAIDYAVDPRRADSFYAAIRTYWPDLPDGGLQPDYAGIRPKIARPGGSTTNFLVQTEKGSRRRGTYQSVRD